MESSNGMSQGSESISQPGSSNASSGVIETNAHKAETERTFRQSEVNDIVKKAKYGAVEDFKRLQSQQPDYAQNKHADNHSQQSDYQQKSLPEDDIRRISQQEILRMRSDWEREAQEKAQADMGQRIANDFLSKMNTGKEKYEDFDKIVGDPRSYGRFPGVVQILSQYVDNAADVLYELRKHGDDRLVRLEMTASDPRFSDEAIRQAQRLSQSIKDNDAAKKIKLPNEPLSQLRPSNTGTDTGVMGVKDLRRKYRV